jgi:hypothetical protein
MAITWVLRLGFEGVKGARFGARGTVVTGYGTGAGRDLSWDRKVTALFEGGASLGISLFCEILATRVPKGHFENLGVKAYWHRGRSTKSRSIINL